MGGLPRLRIKRAGTATERGPRHEWVGHLCEGVETPVGGRTERVERLVPSRWFVEPELLMAAARRE